MIFTTGIVTCAHSFIYLEICLGFYSNVDKLEIVKLTLEKTITQVRVFVNRLGHALNNLDNPKYFFWKRFFYTPSQTLPFLSLSSQDLQL